MFLNEIIIQGAIILGVVVFFLGAVYLNYKTKAPKGVELPEQCGNCMSKSCVIKISDVEKKKEEMREYLKSCEENNNDNPEKK
mgnify:CR=1 FL=1